jgi:hypothetical protein
MIRKISFFLLLLIAFASVSSGQEKEEVLIFADHLEKCTPFKSEFTHPFSGQKMQREIVGITDDKCLYTEEMPNNGKMTCRYDLAQLPVIAKYYRDVAMAKSHSTSAKITTQSDKQEVKITYKINGKEVRNPLQECMQNGTCLISGY